ncbi:MAG: DNA-binding protein Alba [Candidatus Altiarchaeota archaeon]
MGEEEKEVKKEKKVKTEKDSNVVFIGKKGIMSYVLAVVTQFNNGEKEVVIKARGRAISRAVDVAEIVRQRFVKDVETKNISIATEEIESQEGPVKVSAIEITLAK